jgi:hypothetical protein
MRRKTKGKPRGASFQPGAKASTLRPARGPAALGLDAHLTGALLDPSRPASISSRHLSDRSRLRSAGRPHAVSPVPA